MVRQKLMKVKTLSVNWPLFCGTVLFMLGLILFSHAIDPFVLIHYQWSALLCALFLFINTFKCWFAKGWVFYLEVLHAILYLVLAIGLMYLAKLAQLTLFAILIYSLLGISRLILYGRVEHTCLKRRMLIPVPIVSKVWRRLLAKPREQGFNKIWHATLFCGLIDLGLALFLALIAPRLPVLLIANGIDLCSVGLMLFRLGTLV